MTIKNRLLSSTKVRLPTQYPPVPYTEGDITYGGHAVIQKFDGTKWATIGNRIHTLDGWKDES